MQLDRQSGTSTGTALFLLCVLSVAIKLAYFSFFPRIIFPDEIFQNLEPAHYLVHGNNLATWEYIIGLRSWLMPLILAGPMWVGSLLSTDPVTEMLPIRLFMILSSLIPVICAYLWGRNLESKKTGLLIAFCVAAASDLVLMAPHTFNEVLAAHLFVGGVYLAFPGQPESRASRLIAAGIMFALVFTLRIHVAPALLFIYLYVCRLDFRRWLTMGMAAFLTVCISIGFFDWLSWGVPFRTVWVNFTVNIIADVSSSFGTSTAWELLGYILLLWHIPGILFIIFMVSGIKRVPFLFAIALIIIAPHLFIAHKEWRFIFPAMPFFAIVAAFGVVRIGRYAVGKSQVRQWSPKIVYGSLACVWLATSVAMLHSPMNSEKMLHNQARKMFAFNYVSDIKSACGLGLYKIYRSNTPGHSYLPKTINFDIMDAKNFDSEAKAFNVILAQADRPPPQSAKYSKKICFNDNGPSNAVNDGTDCIWQRAGTCSSQRVRQPTVWPGYFLTREGEPDPAKIDPFLPPHSWLRRTD
jgi:GPI mannosyltransferase 3